MFIARIGFAVLTRLVLAVKMDIPGRGAEDSDISCEGVSILKRSVPKRLSLFLSALFFALYLLFTHQQFFRRKSWLTESEV